MINKNTPNFTSNLDVHKKYKRGKHITDESFLLKNRHKFTIKSNKTHMVDTLQSWEKNGLSKVFKPLEGITPETAKHLLKYSQHEGRDAYMYANLSSEQYTQWNLKYLLSRYSTSKINYSNTKLNTWFSLVNVNFLRKERLYTKLKYSRSPAFDIVSGGAAALLAGFIGFLISEKFGYELVDSGDFYYLFMYLVFLAFSLRPLLVVSDASKGFWEAFSIKRVATFYLSLIQLFLKKFK